MYTVFFGPGTKISLAAIEILTILEKYIHNLTKFMQILTSILLILTNIYFSYGQKTYSKIKKNYYPFIDLEFLYIDKEYSKILKKENKYLQNTTYNKEPYLYLYLAKTYYQISNQTNIIKNINLENSFKKCIKYIEKLYQYDPTRKIIKKEAVFIKIVKNDLDEIILNEIDEDHFKLLKTWATYYTKIHILTWEKNFSQLLIALNMYYKHNLRLANKIWNTKLKNILNNIDISNESKIHKELIKTVLIQTKACLINNRNKSLVTL